MADARGLARAALAEITSDDRVGEFLGTREEAEFITSYLWASTQLGYPDWQWTVTVVSLPDAQPSVMELELLPTEASVVAPDWVPWSVRLAEYRDAQAADAAAAQVAGALGTEHDADEIGAGELDADGDGAFDDELVNVSEFDEDDDDEDDDDEDDGDDDDEDDEIDEVDDLDDDIDGVTLPGEDEDEPNS